MRSRNIWRRARIAAAVLILAAVSVSPVLGDSDGKELRDLLSEPAGWVSTEDPQIYFPESLFEYINGAAEIYLSYEFQQLIVAQYRKSGSEASMGVEIYDMGEPVYAFGIYSAERFPDNTFIEVGDQGYIEEGVLNFRVGPYYVKLLAFDVGEETENSLKLFADAVVARTGGPTGNPPVLDLFPQEGRIANAEKFILQNFLGYGFLHDGYLASYRHGDLEFDCFVMLGRDSEDTAEMLRKFLEAKGESAVEKIPEGYLIRDRYYHNIYLAQAGRKLCGVMKIKSDMESIGKRYLRMLREKAGTDEPATGRNHP